MNKALAITIFFLLPGLTRAQSFKRSPQLQVFEPFIKETPDGFYRKKKDTTGQTDKKHSTTKATVFSAVLPGLGQAYNKKYWKIPVFYAGLAGTGYFVLHNRQQMLVRQNALIAMLDGDPSTQADPLYANTSVDQLKADRSYYRANRDYGIIGFAIIYVLNIVDATVDAHFYNFNIDKPLAMQKTKHWKITSPYVQNKPTIGLAYRF